MKTLYIVRHAKSSWDNIELSDHDRPVAPVGIKKTKRIISFLQDKNIKPELLISSSALRAYETASMIAEGIGYDVDKIVKSKALYHAGEDEIFDELLSVDDNINSVMLFGHNPTLTYFVDHFITPGIVNLPTTGTVSIDFMTDSWEEIANSKFNVNFVITPKLLK